MENEIEIIQKCKNGQLEEFGVLYDAYVKKIYSFIYIKTCHKETAEDLVSKTFMKALKNIASFNEEKGTFNSWIYQIARNTVIDHYRTSKTDINIDDVWDLSDKSDIERDIDMKNKIREVEEYLVKLKSSQREIILMRVWQNMSYQEISEVLGKSEASCKMVFSRAINRLREEMPLSVLITFLMTKI